MARPNLAEVQARAAAASGLANPGSLAHMLPGAVFEIDDSLVKFPENPARIPHLLRRVVIVQGFKYLGSGLPRTVLVVPCSSSRAGAERGDYDIPPDEPGFTAPSVVAYATLVMAVLKTDLRPELHRGQMRSQSFGELMAHVRGVLGDH